MASKLTSLHWWFSGVNPFKSLGVFPTLVWLIPSVCFVVYFIPWEYVGVKRINGYAPLTWFIQCCPPALLALSFFMAIDHFILHNKILGPLWGLLFSRK
jgi:hypothetical protein